MPLVLDEDQSSTGFFDLFHDSWSAFPTFVIIDHTMTVRAKPWTLENNSNSNSCDGSNSILSGWSNGNTENFLQQLVEECGSLCEEGGCSTAAGDLNEDNILNIQDLITMVNHILGSSLVTDCALEAADMNMDGIINIQDLISLVNSILGSGRQAQLNGYANVEYIASESDLIISVKSDIDIAGIQLSIINDIPLDIELKDNSHISQDSYYNDGVTKYLAYSIFNQSFDSKTIELLVHSGGSLNMDDFQVSLADINGDLLTLSHSQDSKQYYTGPYSFKLSELYPNPFNPSTEVAFSLPMDSYVKLSAFDIQGREIDVIFEGMQSLGTHSYTWNPVNMPSGLYYVRLQAGEMVANQKALLIK